MTSLIGQALTLFIPPQYRMCNPKATPTQLVVGFLVMDITASIARSVIPKIPPLLNRITPFNIPVALLEVSKCVGWVFTAQYLYGVALSLLLGRSWLVKAVVLGIFQGVISSLIKTAITAIFWSKRARELEEAKKKWNQFLKENPIIPLQGTIHDQFSNLQESFFENAKKLRTLSLERLKTTKNQKGVEYLRKEIKRSDCGNNVLTRFLEGGSFPISGREFLELKEQIRSMVFESIVADEFLEEKERRLLDCLRNQYDALLRMLGILDPMQNAGRELSQKNDTDNLIESVALNNCSRELIQRGLAEASSMPKTEKLMMSMCTFQAVLHLLTRYPAFSSFPILVDAITCLLSEFMNQLRAPGLPHVVETLGKIEPLQKALAPLEEVMNGIAGLQKEFEAILPEEAKDPASQ